VVVELECGVTVYPAVEEEGRWRAVWYKAARDAGWLVADGRRVIEGLLELAHLEPGCARGGGGHVSRATPRFASLSGMAHRSR
jgi:hypothetical protein